MPSGIKISPEVEAKILELGNQGKSHKGISFELGISKNALDRILSPKVHRRRMEGQRRRRIFMARIVVNGARRRVRVDGRRPKPRECELCHKIPRFGARTMHWHHWNNEHPEWGLWLCGRCHLFADMIEKGLTASRYEELKEWARTLSGASGKSGTPIAVNVP